MVIYEVNLTINNEIYERYYIWLVAHTNIMLQFKGFQQAEIANEINTTEIDKTKLTLRYLVDSEENLNDYLKNHAPKMREDGTNKFGDKFSASRRIFKIVFTTTAHDEKSAKCSFETI